MQLFVRILAFGLLLAVMIPFAWAVKLGVSELPTYWRDMGVAAVVGFGLCYALWRWSDRIQERRARGEPPGFWD